LGTFLVFRLSIDILCHQISLTLLARCDVSSSPGCTVEQENVGRGSHEGEGLSEDPGSWGTRLTGRLNSLSASTSALALACLASCLLDILCIDCRKLATEYSRALHLNLGRAREHQRRQLTPCWVVQVQCCLPRCPVCINFFRGMIIKH
jgi:hypothetical protein